MMRIVPLLLILAVSLALPVWAEDDVLGLERAVTLALDNSPLLAAGRAGVEEAEAGVAAAEARRWPTVSLSEVGSRTTNPVAVFGGLLSQEAFGPENFDVDFLNEPDPLTNFMTRLAVEQPLWTGGRIASGIAAAEAGAEAAAAELSRVRQRVVHGVIEAYSNAILAARQREVAAEALETAEAHVALIRDLREAGLVVASDLLQAQVRASELEEMVVRAENAVAVARAGLNMAMGLPLDRPHALPDDLAEPPATELSLEALEAEARQRNARLAALERQLSAARRMVDAAESQRWPEIGLSGAYEANDEDPFGTAGQNWSVMAAARWTAFDGGATRAAVRQARARAEQLARQLEHARSEVGLDVRSAWHALRAARRRQQTAQQSVEMARESLRIVEDRYREGLVNLVELLEAETALTRARTRAVEARLDLRLSRAALDLAVGRLGGDAAGRPE